MYWVRCGNLTDRRDLKGAGQWLSIANGANKYMHFWKRTLKNYEFVYYFIVLDGSSENGNTAMSRAVLGKEMPAGCQVVVKFHSVKSEELASSVPTVCWKQELLSVSVVTNVCYVFVFELDFIFLISLSKLRFWSFRYFLVISNFPRVFSPNFSFCNIYGQHPLVYPIMHGT